MRQSNLRAMRKIIATSVVIMILAGWPGAVAGGVGGSPAEDIPLDSWVYDAVFSLSTRGHFAGLLLHSRPYTRGEVTAGVATLLLGQNDLTAGERIVALRLEQEFTEELAGSGSSGFRPGARLGAGPNARSDQFENGRSINRFGFDAVAGVTPAPGVTARARVRFDSDGRSDSQFHGEYWKENFTAWMEQAVVTISYRRFRGAFGREFWRWGRSPSDVMLISDHSPPFDGVRLSYRGRNWSFAYHATRLDPMLLSDGRTAQRYLAAHRFDWRVRPNLEIALSEVILFGGVDRPWELNYLNPILPYYWEQLNSDTDDNPLWSLELSWRPLRGWEIYGEWMVDDFQIDFVSEPQQIGALGGVAWWPDLLDGRLSVNAEYQRINTFVYGQRKPWNRYFHYRDLNGRAIGIGSAFGPDTDRITIRPRWRQSPFLDLVALIEYARRGADRIDTPQEPGGVPYTAFPSGRVERRLTLGFGIHGQRGGHLILDLLAGYEHVENADNVPGADRDGPFIQLRFVSLWWKTFGI